MRKTVYLIGLMMVLSVLYGMYSTAFPEDSQDELWGVAVDSNGDVVVVGQHYEGDKFVMRVQKYDGNDGKIKWQTDYSKYQQNIGKAVTIDENGNIYAGGVAGEEVAGIPIPSTNYLIVKYDKNGNKLWDKTYDNGFADFLTGMGVDEDGNVYATGMTLYIDVASQNLSNIDFWTLKIDPSNGNLIKDDKFDSEIDAAFGMDVRGDTIVVAGSVQEGDTSKYCLVKYDKNLEKDWVKYYYNGKSCSASDACILSNGNIAITGNEEEDFMTILYDSNGNVKSGWPKREKNDGKDDALGVAVDSNGNVIVGGYKSVNLQKRWYIVKYGSNGWDKTENINGEIRRIAVDKENNIIAAGYKIEGGKESYCIRKYSPNGNLIWESSEENPSQPTHADFIWLPEEPTRADLIHFYDKSTGAIISWSWDFGDGTTSNERNPTHRYDEIGTYTVTLRVTGEGIDDTISKEITVKNALPVADFSYTPLNPVEGQEISFNADAEDKDGSIENYTWNFGDGSVGYGKNVKHTYGNAGNYSVDLTVYDNDGDYKKITKLVIVSPVGENSPPVAYFEMKTQAGKGEEVEVNASGSYDEDGEIIIYSWDWNGDGEIDDEFVKPSAVHYWYADGEYNVVLIVEDDKGYQSAYTKTIKIGGLPEINIDLPDEIKMKKGEEKTVKIKIGCLNQSIYDVNFSVEGDAEIIPSITGFNISAGSEVEIPVALKADKSSEIKIKVTGKDIERDIIIESNMEAINLIIEKGTPSFTLLLSILAIMFIAIYFRKLRK